jgi:threonylcarbamoyladenosine tRNA methylthiotransferase MtaB
LARHLERQVGRVVHGLVEKPGLARATDFTELRIHDTCETGSIAALRVTGHDGRVAFAAPLSA